MKTGYVYLPHTADIKFQAFGKTVEECFKNAGYALMKIICKDEIDPKERKTIKVRGKDRESLLYNFLEEFLYILEVGGFLIAQIDNVRIVAEKKRKKYESVLTADVFGDDIKNYNADTHVKAITYNDMFVKQEKIRGKNRFTCQVVVDV